MRTPPPLRNEGWGRTVVAAVVGGVVALLLVIVLQASGFLPVPGRTAATEARSQAQSAVDSAAALDRRMTAVEAMTADLPAIRSDIKDLTDKASALASGAQQAASRADVDGLKTQIADLGKRVDSIPPAASPQDLAALTNRVQGLEALPTGGAGADTGQAAAIALGGRIDDVGSRLAALGQRVDAVEAKIAALANTSSAAAESDAAARAMAVVSLRRAADGDQPFAADVDLAMALGLSGDAVNALRPLAVRGVPTVAEIEAEFPPVADAIVSATTADNPNAGFFERMVGTARGLVTIRPTTPQPGNDPPAVLSRMVAAVDGGDLARALAEREALPAAGKDASAAWAAEASDRVTVDRLLAEISGPTSPPAQ